MSNPFFSIIIPCYKYKSHILRALVSLEQQSYKKFEVIFVDDHSPDDSYDFLLKYQKKSSLNMILLRNDTNRGPGYSRNNGIQIASGQFIAFMDSDDWYEDDLLESVYSKVIEDKADLVFFDFYRSYDNQNKSTISCTRLLTNQTDKSSVMALCFDSLCTLCVKKEIFSNIQIPHLYNAEDAVTVPLLVSHASVISILKRPLYNYLYRFNSLSSSKDKNIAYSFLDAYSFLENKVPKCYNEAVEYKGVVVVLYGCVFKSVQSGFTNQEILMFIDRFITAHPTCFSNKYLKYLPFRKKAFIFFVRHKFFFALKVYVKLQVFLLNLPLFFHLSK